MYQFNQGFTRARFQTPPKRNCAVRSDDDDNPPSDSRSLVLLWEEIDFVFIFAFAATAEPLLTPADVDRNFSVSVRCVGDGLPLLLSECQLLLSSTSFPLATSAFSCSNFSISNFRNIAFTAYICARCCSSYVSAGGSGAQKCRIGSGIPLIAVDNRLCIMEGRDLLLVIPVPRKPTAGGGSTRLMSVSICRPLFRLLFYKHARLFCDLTDISMEVGSKNIIPSCMLRSFHGFSRDARYY